LAFLLLFPIASPPFLTLNLFHYFVCIHACNVLWIFTYLLTSLFNHHLNPQFIISGHFPSSSCIYCSHFWWTWGKTILGEPQSIISVLWLFSPSRSIGDTFSVSSPKHTHSWDTAWQHLFFIFLLSHISMHPVWIFGFQLSSNSAGTFCVSGLFVINKTDAECSNPISAPTTFFCYFLYVHSWLLLSSYPNPLRPLFASAVSFYS
jgi:hypothetical protein